MLCVSLSTYLSICLSVYLSIYLSFSVYLPVLRTTTACAAQRAICHLLPRQMAPHPPLLASLVFDHPESQLIGKHKESRLCYLFVHLHLLSSDSFFSLIFFLLLLLLLPLFSSLILPTCAFYLFILSEVWLLNFLRSYTEYPSYWFEKNWHAPNPWHSSQDMLAACLLLNGIQAVAITFCTTVIFESIDTHLLVLHGLSLFLWLGCRSRSHKIVHVSSRINRYELA